MAKHENLTSLFTDIAEAIREKTGDAAGIAANDFPEAIAAIDTQEDLESELATQDDLIEQITTTLSRKLPENLDSELSTQDDLIAQIAVALEGKCGVMSELPNNAILVNEINTVNYLPIFAKWNDICFGGDKFVAIPANSNTFIYSYDGLYWETTSIPLSSSVNWNSIAYGNGVFVAISDYQNQCAYSYDGIEWVVKQMWSGSGFPERWSEVIWDGQRFFAIPYNGKYFLYSETGIGWDYINNPLGDGVSHKWYTVTSNGNGLYVAATFGDDNGIYYSNNNGNTWQQASSFPDIGTMCFTQAVYGNGVFVVMQDDMQYFPPMYSTDGNTWQYCNLSSRDYTDVIFNGEKFLALNRGSSKVAVSIDGINWTESNLPRTPLANDWMYVAYGNGKFVTIMNSENIIMTSSDGLNWVETANKYQLTDLEGNDITNNYKIRLK